MICFIWLQFLIPFSLSQLVFFSSFFWLCYSFLSQFQLCSFHIYFFLWLLLMRKLTIFTWSKWKVYFMRDFHIITVVVDCSKVRICDSYKIRFLLFLYNKIWFWNITWPTFYLLTTNSNQQHLFICKQKWWNAIIIIMLSVKWRKIRLYSVICLFILDWICVNISFSKLYCIWFYNIV